MKKIAFCFIIYSAVCFGGLAGLYMLGSLLMGEPAFPWVLFGWNYHVEHPMQYICVVAVCYALVAARLLFYEQNNISAFKKMFLEQVEFAMKEYF
jgi:hypothetical protein